MTGLFVSAMRTGVPLVAGWLLTLAVRAGVGIDSATVTGAVTVAAAFAYYVVFRVLEVLGERARGTALQNIAGVLLGWARPPAYPRFEALEPVDGARYLGGESTGG
ncbi:hypothetical protein [Streptomyces sp. NBC_00582]|uniref:hypothetical protein n=1 Tax=Streptomyces sp. NBC_00582 TaxID=2975783 RepID=UPI002E801D1A|nr:hypothetical protein [Streptomyces sp. NBC_00582]WUB64598.1 hypothetical protein OG852_31465 [Streptomyces sp. NBC_00582]